MTNNTISLLTTKLRTTLVVICAIVATALIADGALAAGFTVNSTADTSDNVPGDGLCDDGSGQCTLRAAIEEANALAGTDVITLPAGTYTLALGELNITSDIVIQGADAVVDANLNSRVFKIVGSNTVTLNNLTIQNGLAESGGGIYHDGGNVTLTSVTVTLNTANGIIYPDGGGGIYNKSGSINLLNTHVFSNEAYLNGGGIYNQGHLLWNGGQLFNNQAVASIGSAGGGLFNADGALADLHNLHIANNSSTQSGGGILSAGWLTITESVVESNLTGSNVGNPLMLTGGGGLGIDSGIKAIAVLRNVIIRNNQSEYSGGGGICIAHTAYLDASNVEIYNNLAGTDGGGIGVNCQYDWGSLLAAYSSPLKNTNYTRPPRYRSSLLSAWPISPNIVMTNINVYSNTAGGMGGGIHNDGARMSIRESNIRDNRTTWYMFNSHGGGLSVISGTVGLDDVRVEDNAAALNGGGIYNTAGLHIRNGTVISGNLSGSEMYAYGGGLYNSGDVTLGDTALLSNTTWGNGGGIYNTGNITLYGNIHVARNQALIYPFFTAPSGHGGGIYIWTNGSLTLGPEIQLIGNWAELDGGGIYVTSTQLSIFNNPYIQLNASGRNGGGIFAAGSVVISQSQLLSNTAAGDGGAVYFTSTHGLIYKSTLASNHADGVGGGIAAISASVRMSNTTISGNSAARGGGLMVYPNGSAALNNVTLAYNSAADTGASIYALGNTLLANTIVAHDTASGVMNCAGGSVTSNGYNLETGTDCGFTAFGDQQNTDPLLGPLALNAPGNTWTHALSGWPPSPAIDAANNATCEPDDQRSVTRPIGTSCDIGAYEADLPDLAVSKSDGGAVIQPGETVTYTILYTNVGRGIAVGVVLSDILPAYLEFIGPLGASGWFTAGGGVYTYSLGNLPPGASGAIQLIARPVQPWYWGNLAVTNTVQISGGPGEEDLSNNIATDTTLIQASFDLRVSKHDHGRLTHSSGLITYTIVYTNHGNMVAAGVVLTEMIPTHTTYLGSGWAQVGSSAVYTQWIGDVLPGQVGTATLVVQVSDPLPPGVTLVSNTVLIGDNSIFGTDTNPANNRFTVNSRVGAVDPAVHISDGGISVTAGSLLTYTISFTNVGSFTATNVLLTFSLPTHTQSAGNPLWTLVAPGIYSYAIGTLAPGQAGTVTFVVQVDSSLPDTVQFITATVAISDDGLHGTDINIANNTASDATPIFRPTAVTLVYLVAVPHPSGGALVRWQTATEHNTWGFHLLRSATGSLEDAERVTPSLIPGGNPHGATYEWHDTGALPGRRYSYWLQEIELDGTPLIYGPVHLSTTHQVYLPIVRR